MIEHLEESTNTVKSNKKLILAIAANVFLLLFFILFNSLIVKNNYLIFISATLGIISTCVLLQLAQLDCWQFLYLEISK